MGAEWDISARPKRPLRLPLNGPGAVELGVRSEAQDQGDGEVEHHDAHRVQCAAHTQEAASGTTANDTHPFTKPCVTFHKQRWSDHVNLEVEVALSLNLRSQDG